MRYGIPLLGDRVAPRCTFADSVMIVVLRRNRVYTEEVAALSEHGVLDLTKVLADYKIDILVCGGISRQEREFINTRRVQVIDNVAGSRDELLDALGAGAVHPGFGLAETAGGLPDRPAIQPQDGKRLSASDHPRGVGSIDCLACHNRVCLTGEPCDAAEGLVSTTAADGDINQQLEASLDISSEDERTLCRLSELIYFCLEMRYQRIGVAYCVDLQEPTEILVRVLRRFFKVYPVCCKIGGIAATNPMLAPQEPGSRNRPSVIACNPIGQADALRRIGTDLNVLVGMCMGSDSIFTRLSDAPVTTLFVKDRSLANNPIGAIYSDYYLREAIQTSPLCHREESIE
jgi:uncharacterized metal-binding protein/predicted Fe-Mo cluster-binding NifX family protein